MAESFEQLLAYLESGGWVMPPLVIGALVLWYALGVRLLTLRRGNRRSVRVLIERYRRGYPRRPHGLVDAAVVRALAVVGQQRRPLRRQLEEALADLFGEARRFSTLTQAIVTAAPLCGLLGTVVGMVETFDALADMSLFSQTGGVAGGISQALFSTQLGLAVAVPGLVVGRALGRRQELIEQELTRIINILCAEASEQASAQA
jgi:biopolymer transport protein ExbB